MTAATFDPEHTELQITFATRVQTDGMEPDYVLCLEGLEAEQLRFWLSDNTAYAFRRWNTSL